MLRKLLFTATYSLVLSSASIANADWDRFRGPNGTGLAESPVPTEFGESKNLSWKLELPGRGISSPIVVGDKVFVTCYSGYGMGDGEGEIDNLKRHLVCADRISGKTLWEKTVPATQPEDLYRPPGVSTHGYASNTPVSDGKHVFAFFGKSGVYAYDLDGNEIWHQSVGTGPSDKGFGSAASPVVTDKHVIVNAADESLSLVWLDKATGEVFHSAEANGLTNCWSTPVLVKNGDTHELVISVVGEVWGMNAETAKLTWWAEGVYARNAQVSVLADKDGTIYAIGEDAFAIQTGGKDDVSKSHTKWKGRARSRYATPVLVDGLLYSVSGSVVECINAENGERVYQERLPSASGNNQRRGRGEAGRGGRGGGFGGRGGFGGGGFGGDDYASPIVADGKLYISTNSGVVHVVETGSEFNLVASNDMSFDSSGFGSTPAASDGQLFLRSNKYLYCISEK